VFHFLGVKKSHERAAKCEAKKETDGEPVGTRVWESVSEPEI
jgi:hypothetical protein